MLRLEELNKVYRTGDVETTALDRVSLTIELGAFVAVMGPSGCGKSTLLNIIAMLDNPTEGKYFFLEHEISRWPESRLTELRKHHVGFIFQSFNLIEELSVFENIELALLYHRIPARERRQRVEAVMERMGIAHRARHRP
ncbi:MAG: ABC transporter ATP-binding protein, partial [Rhodothalassiaceae bacterium]